jgi:3-hydroxybutyryl-CoA dehydrogenase
VASKVYQPLHHAATYRKDKRTLMLDSKPIHRIGVCGIGQMGTAAAVCYKRAGYQVVLWDNDATKRESAAERLAELEVWLEKHVGLSHASGGDYLPVFDLSNVDERADLIMDCIVEDMAQKVELFRSFPSAIERQSIFITTTSGLSVTEMGQKSGTGHLLAGTHFWNPPHLMPLVEVVRGRDTTENVLARVTEVVESIGKIPVRVNRDVPGFIGNRLLHALWREAIYLVQEGIASAEDIDRVARLTFGLRMPAVGPLENMDLVGLDLIKQVHQCLLADLSNDAAPLRGLQELVSDGNLGMKSGKGFYDWLARDGNELIERRNVQIVHQLAFLKKLDER